ncbi:hypothetical protein F511_05444 [Dorcoceras hygrometricum]|uniref:Uncharacterized protein n=1 Tax=Dorcoceras hygrometricum TaxID=472368 RepID=A0A2Z7BTT1_9LAMI|nr:hypothetical protein F511_05444 [Dorcoceras hygrometricum]
MIRISSGNVAFQVDILSNEIGLKFEVELVNFVVEKNQSQRKTSRCVDQWLRCEGSACDWVTSCWCEEPVAGEKRRRFMESLMVWRRRFDKLKRSVLIVTLVAAAGSDDTYCSNVCLSRTATGGV